MKNSGKRIKTGFILRVLWAAACLLPVQAIAEDYQELLFFPYVHTEFVPHEEEYATHEQSEVDLGADIFFALNFNKTRFLGEVLVTSDEVELERAQLGWEVRPKHYLWLGRFHSPLGYWNTQYNHAAFLQTSVHRPAIAEYEDHGGVLPMHAAGLLFEGESSLAEGALEYSFTYGVGTQLSDEGLESIRLVDASEHKASLNSFIRAAYRPDELSNSRLGVFAGYSEITPAEDFSASVSQVVAGAYVNKEWLVTKALVAAYYVNNELNDNGVQQTSSFAAMYMHGEYELGRSWISFARYEVGIGTENDAYLSRFGDFTDKLTAGLRRGIGMSHAIGLEASAVVANGNLDSHFSLQWSAVFP